jgi:aspartate/methionine/tyrosine aminotransferase
LDRSDGAGLDLSQLESAFRDGAKVFLFSNPNNPTGVVYSSAEIQAIAELANRHGVTVVADQLYSRLRYDGTGYTHLRAAGIDADHVMTIMGPSKTESLSGYRLGVAFGAPKLIERMEKLQAIVSLRAPGYCQAVLSTWFAEPGGWLEERIAHHQAIRDRLLAVLREVEGVRARTPQAGSYLFPRLPALAPSLSAFLSILRVQAGVTVTAGSEFGVNATDNVRLNFSQNADAAMQAIGRMALLIERYRA